tara:strand:+ start:1181 stop:2845 length:1665 start_codon:yes stop_codon:yes gene_type:complete
MSEVQDILKADGGISDLTDVMGTGHGINTGQEASTIDAGVGGTFLTEPLHAQFVALLEEASFVRQIAKTIPMTQPTLRVPAITSGLQVFYQEEQGVEAVETQMSAGDFTLEARKIMAQVIATAELYEDSQQNIEQIITSDFVRAIAQAEEQAFLLGRMTALGGVPKGSTGAGTVQGGSPASTLIGSLTNFVRDTGLAGTATFAYDHWGTQSGSWSAGTAEGSATIATSPLKICDGVVTTALDENTIVDMQGASFRGQLAYKAIREAIFKMGLLGRERSDLILILNPVASNQLLQSDELMTLDKYGSNATILTGEVGSLFGVKIIESSFLPSNGVLVDGTTTYGQGGYGVLVHKPSLLLGDLRKVQVENERIIQNDAYRTVISERLAFGMERRTGAVAIGNIASDVSSLSSGTSVFVAGGLKPGIGGASTATITDAVADDKLAVTLDLTNLEIGETTSIIASSIDETGIATGANLNLKITATSVSSNFSANADVSAGALVSLGTIASPSGTVTLNWDVKNAVAGAGDVVYKFALYDGAQYSDVHTFVLTLTDSTA